MSEEDKNKISNTGKIKEKLKKTPQPYRRSSRLLPRNPGSISFFELDDRGKPVEVQNQPVASTSSEAIQQALKQKNPLFHLI